MAQQNLTFPESLKTLGNALDMNEESELFTELSSLETIEVDKGKVLICYPRKKAGTEFFVDGTT